MIRQGLANLRALGAESRRPFYLSLLAEALVSAGQPDEARAVVDAALATAAQNRDVWWSAELHRRRGVLSDTPEEWLERALEIARSQASKSLELRVAVSLGRLWKDRGSVARARTLVGPVYKWFTEGFQTTDLIEAQHLLAELQRFLSWSPASAYDLASRGARPVASPCHERLRERLTNASKFRLGAS